MKHSRLRLAGQRRFAHMIDGGRFEPAHEITDLPRDVRSFLEGDCRSVPPVGLAGRRNGGEVGNILPARIPVDRHQKDGAGGGGRLPGRCGIGE